MKKLILETTSKMKVFKDCVRKFNMDIIEGVYGIYREANNSFVTFSKNSYEIEQIHDKVKSLLDIVENSTTIIDFTAISLRRRNRIGIAFELNNYIYDVKGTKVSFGFVYITSNDGFCKCTYYPVLFIGKSFVPIGKRRVKLNTVLGKINDQYFGILDSLHNGFCITADTANDLSNVLREKSLFEESIVYKYFEEDDAELKTRVFRNGSSLDKLQYLSLRFAKWFNSPQVFARKANATIGKVFKGVV